MAEERNLVTDSTSVIFRPGSHADSYAVFNIFEQTLAYLYVRRERPVGYGYWASSRMKSLPTRHPS